MHRRCSPTHNPLYKPVNRPLKLKCPFFGIPEARWEIGAMRGGWVGGVAGVWQGRRQALEYGTQHSTNV